MGSRGCRLLGTLLVLSAMAVCAGPLAAARASALPGLTLGFSRNDIFSVGSGELTGLQWEDRAQTEGAQIIRVAVDWSSIAPATRPAGFDAADPSSPGYDWTALDASITSLAARGFTLLLTVQGAPTWAEGNDAPAGTAAGSWRPSPRQFAAFATALATRYDGHTANPAVPGTDLPRVHDFQGWNEPNMSIYLAPQWVRAGTRWRAESPTLYRGMENAFYAAIKRVSAANTVVLAGTSAFGDPPGGARMAPVTFDGDLLSADTSFDVFDHHPSGLTAGPGTHAALPGDVAVPDLDKLTRILDAAERDGHALPRGSKPLWVTELWLNTDPPDRSDAVSLTTQADDLELSLYELWHEGASVVLWEMMADDAPDPSLVDALQAGLYFENGTPKPSATAFAFPFIAGRTSSDSVFVWGRAPGAGQLLIQRRDGADWVTVKRLIVTTHQVFAAIVDGRAGVYRAQVADQTSLAFSTSTR